jgi:hypothetical protein
VVCVVDARVSSKSYVFKGEDTSQTIDLSPLKGLEEVVFKIHNLKKPDSWVVEVLKTICNPKQIRRVTFNKEFAVYSTEHIRNYGDEFSENWSGLDQIFQEWAGEELEIVFKVFAVCVLDPVVDIDKFLGCCRKGGKVTVRWGWHPALIPGHPALSPGHPALSFAPP